MTTAFNFPDLDISPIRAEGEDESDVDGRREQQLISRRNPSVNDDNALHEVLGGLSISGDDNFKNPSDVVRDYNGESFEGIDHVFRERSSQINVNSTTSAGSCRPIAAGDSFNTSSEEVFAAMECEMRHGSVLSLNPVIIVHAICKTPSVIFLVVAEW
ncbi:hypothetical protein KIN20_013732 [Parelaphostrongylus tenuis]|uniref:Uncharacterized protein n=1 Tax=Parelaphostrongylus tenuis TaxID=148309 RepID=A0AAD5QR88_PARTN|nr:hypothetical protein KIN20_013732 [Parelaphostrongylus tenuis]